MIEFFKNKVQNFIFVSSDSDLWALICSIPEAKILVLAERSKSGEMFIESLTQSNIQVIFMEDIIEPSTELMDRIMRRKLRELKTNAYIDAKHIVITAAQELNLYLKPEDLNRYISEYREGIVPIEDAVADKVIVIPRCMEKASETDEIGIPPESK